MLALAVDILSWAALLGGGFFYVVGAIGLNRMPDVFTRMHAVSVGETLGIGLMILGMVLQTGFSLVAVKLLIIMVVMLWTGSVATHALARAALHDGIKPILADPSGRLVPTDLVSLFPELGVRLAAPLSSEVVEEAPARPPTDSGDPAAESTAEAEINTDARIPGPGSRAGA